MTLVDSNVLIDVVGADERWKAWSVAQLDAARPRGLFINGVVYAEVSRTFDSPHVLDRFLEQGGLEVKEPTRRALWSAGAAHGRYREAGGERERVLPDFVIGAHAKDVGCELLTRDPRRYRTYFPNVRLIAP